MLIWVTLFAVISNSLAFADEKVYLIPEYTKNLIVDFKQCKDSLNKNKKGNVLLKEINEKEQIINKNLRKQKNICDENYKIIETQAAEWKESYMKSSEDLAEALNESIFSQWYFWLAGGVLIGLGIPVIL